MDLKLTIVGGKANKSQITVTLPSVIGRSREADLTVAHPMISRKHCELYEVNGLVKVRDLGSLNGLFVGGRQVNEAALHPNAEFSVGPLTFRVEYQYAGEMVAEPNATTISETSEAGKPGLRDVEVADQPEGAGRAAGLAPDDQTPAPGDEEVTGEGPSPLAEVPPTIAPPDGELPDFSAWGVPEAEQDRQQADQPQPPSVASSGEEAPAAGAIPMEEGQTLEAAPPSDPAPTVSLPATAAFEPGELPELAQTHGPSLGQDEGDQPPKADGGEPVESEAPPTEQSAGAADEETRETAPPPAWEAGPAREEGMFDLDPPPSAEADESDDAGTGDKELDEFLKGLE